MQIQFGKSCHYIHKACIVVLLIFVFRKSFVFLNIRGALFNTFFLQNCLFCKYFESDFEKLLLALLFSSKVVDRIDCILIQQLDMKRWSQPVGQCVIFLSKSFARRAAPGRNQITCYFLSSGTFICPILGNYFFFQMQLILCNCEVV